ncbi:olfactory receptor 11A1-like [Rhinophrynus dorsalis]
MQSKVLTQALQESRLLDAWRVLHSMHKGNSTRILEVWITGIENLQETRIILFMILLIIYILILIGNFLIIVLVSVMDNLHSPMYFFLCSLSFSEILFTTDLIPFFLHVLLKDGAFMDFTSCLAQWYVSASLAATECVLFAVMSYDRYMAICNPLHYALVMNLRFCQELVICSWTGGFMIMLILLIQVCQLYFCGPKDIDHFFCDLFPILNLSCSDTFAVKAETFIVTFLGVIFPLVFVIGTYVCIILAISKIHSVTGRKKTFSTCSSHLAVVCTYYGTLIALYVVPHEGLSSKINKILSLLYTFVTPLFNPIIYSLRNQEIKSGLKKFLADLI